MTFAKPILMNVPVIPVCMENVKIELQNIFAIAMMVMMEPTVKMKSTNVKDIILVCMDLVSVKDNIKF